MMGRYTYGQANKALEDMKTITKYDNSFRPIVRWWDENAEEYQSEWYGYGQESDAVSNFMKHENAGLQPVLFLYNDHIEYEIVLLGELEDWA